MTIEVTKRAVWIPRVALVLVIALGAFLRLYRVQDESAWCDEALSLRHFNEDGIGPFLAAVQKDNAPTVPLYFAIEYIWARTISDTVVSLRVLSIVFGCLTILSMYLIGKALCGRLAGLFVALMTAIHPMQIYYSQEIRMYQLGWLWCVLSVYTLVRILTTPRPRWWALHALVNLALLWTHLFNSFLLVVEGLFLTYYYVRRRQWLRLGQWCILQAALVSTLSIWSLLLANHDNITTAMAWAPQLSSWVVQDVLGQYLGYAYLLRDFSRSSVVLELNTVSRYGLIVVTVAAFFYLLVKNFRGKSEAAPTLHTLTRGEAFALVSLWAIAPILCLALVSLLLEPAFISRYVGYASLAFYLTTGMAFARFRSRPIAIGLCLTTAALLCVQTTLDARQRPVRCGWKAAARCINSAPDQEVFTNDPAAYISLTYYLGRDIAFVPEHTDVEDWRRLMPFLSAQRRPGWMVFASYSWDAMLRFEQTLKEKKLLYTKNVIPGSSFPLVVYHIVPPAKR